MKTQNTIIRIAIADDHVLFREMLSSILNDSSYIDVSIQANNGKELLERIFAAEQIPDICILDIDMPIMNGLETMIHIRKNWSHLKVLALTMLSHSYTIHKLVVNGLRGYLHKDCNPSELINAIHQIHTTGYYQPDFLHPYTSHQMTIEITKRENEVLKLCVQDYATKEIAEKMGISSRTVEMHFDSLYKKLNINTRYGLMLFALQSGIATLSA